MENIASRLPPFPRFDRVINNILTDCPTPVNRCLIPHAGSLQASDGILRLYELPGRLLAGRRREKRGV